MSFSLFLVAGILLQHHMPIPAWLVLGLAGITLVLVWTILQSSGAVLGFLWTLTVLGGMVRYAQVQAYYQAIEDELAPLHGQNATVHGKVLTVSPTQRGLRYDLKIDRIAAGDHVAESRIKLHLFTDDSVRLDMGRPVQIAGRFETLDGPRNPGEFDFRSFYHRRNVWGQIFPPDPMYIRQGEAGGKLDLRDRIERFRHAIGREFDVNVGGDPAGLLSALIVGLRKELPNEIEENFADSGVIHVLAVSGLHVGYVLIILSALIKLLRVPYRWDKLLLILALLGFAVLSGGKPSVWRATVMASLFVMAPLLKREANIWNILAASAIILLVIHPSDLFDPGFLLSYSAVIAIVFLYRQFETVLPDRFRVSSIRNPLYKGAAALFIVSLSAQIGTIPFTWSFFNRIPVASVAANVLVVPMVGVLVATGIATVTLGTLIPQAGWALGNAAWGFSEVIFWFTREFSRFPLSFFRMPAPSVLNLLQYALMVFTMLLVVRKDLRTKGMLLGAVTLNLLVWPWALQSRTLDVIFLDVGQGDAAVIRVPAGLGKSRTLLVDAGRKDVYFDAGERTVVPVMRYLGVGRVDLLIMSHPHNDHIGGVETVMEELQVTEIWDTYSRHRSQLYDRIMGTISNRPISYRRVEAGEWDDRFSPLELSVIYPDSAWASHQKNVNNTSLVVKAVYGDAEFLLLGDVEGVGDREILTFGDFVRSDVMKVGHHGSLTSTSPELLQAVEPEFAVVSVGKRNRFGHPSQEVLKRIDASGAQVLRTDQEGAVWFKSDGRTLWRHNWR